VGILIPDPEDGTCLARFQPRGGEIRVREQNGSGWNELAPEVRLINRKLLNWVGELPPAQHCDITLSGDLLRFPQP
jgi:hypothetical protein